MNIVVDPTLITCSREQGSDSLMRLTITGQANDGTSVSWTLVDHADAMVGVARGVLQAVMEGRSRPAMVDHWIDVALRRALPDDAPDSPAAAA